MDEEIRLRAHHEAGHAVAAAVLGTPIKRASLSVVTTLLRVGCQRARRNEAIIALSGPAAEDESEGYSADEREKLWHTVRADDWANALHNLAGGDSDLALRRARRFVRRNWSPRLFTPSTFKEKPTGRYPHSPAIRPPSRGARRITKSHTRPATSQAR
jgi:hypothetical protein